MGSRTIGLVIGVSWTPDCTISTLRHLASRGRRNYPISPANATEPRKGTGALGVLNTRSGSASMAASARQHLKFTRWRGIRRVLDPRSALVTRSFDIDRARTRIVSGVSDGQVRYRPR